MGKKAEISTKFASGSAFTVLKTITYTNFETHLLQSWLRMFSISCSLPVYSCHSSASIKELIAYSNLKEGHIEA